VADSNCTVFVVECIVNYFDSDHADCVTYNVLKSAFDSVANWIAYNVKVGVTDSLVDDNYNEFIADTVANFLVNDTPDLVTFDFTKVSGEGSRKREWILSASGVLRDDQAKLELIDPLRLRRTAFP
jgi:hypothetical protein